MKSFLEFIIEASPYKDGDLIIADGKPGKIVDTSDDRKHHYVKFGGEFGDEKVGKMIHHSKLKLQEDEGGGGEAAPTNTVGSGNIAGTTGDPPVGREAQKKIVKSKGANLFRRNPLGVTT